MYTEFRLTRDNDEHLHVISLMLPAFQRFLPKSHCHEDFPQPPGYPRYF